MRLQGRKIKEREREKEIKTEREREREIKEDRERERGNKGRKRENRKFSCSNCFLT